MQPLPPQTTQRVGEARDHLPAQATPSNAGPALPQTADLAHNQKQDAPVNSTSTSNPPPQPKKRKNRRGKKKRDRRQSFAAPPSETSAVPSTMENGLQDFLAEEPNEMNQSMRPGDSFYRRRSNRSRDSLDSDALLDHRHQPQAIRPRRESRLNPLAINRASAPLVRQHSGHHHHRESGSRQRRPTSSHNNDPEEDDPEPTDTSPLIPIPAHHSPARSGYGIFKSKTRTSSVSTTSHRANRSSGAKSFPKFSDEPAYDVNYPPSMPGSPHLNSHNDPMLPEPDFMSKSPAMNRHHQARGDALIEIDVDDQAISPNSAPPSPRQGLQRRALTFHGEDDVCFPVEALSELAEEDFDRSGLRDDPSFQRPRRKKREWPQLWVLEEWSREENEDRAAANHKGTHIVREPVMVDGRLRPSKVTAWRRPQEDAPYRYTYFNEEFENTIHAGSISELVQPGTSFRNLFIPEPPLLEDTSSESESEPDLDSEGKKESQQQGPFSPKSMDQAILQLTNSRLSSVVKSHSRNPSRDTTTARSVHNSGDRTPLHNPSTLTEKPKKYGPRPTFWLDIMSPTEQEMRVLGKAFGIHALTVEDILMEEAREKVELFKNYYFINYRTFEQDKSSEDYLDPINMYVMVFRHGLISVHFKPIPHPANVRRRVRQLKDYLILSADWISYAIIDDITDTYGPLITSIEQEVDQVDDDVLNATTSEQEKKKESSSVNEKNGDARSIASTSSSSTEGGSPGIDMLRRVGECRKKVMSLYRLLGNKAEVIKGFAKRCNEDWAVAPKSEIGLYLGDIQDHILTMTSNLSHYETLLSRAHSNYLAQVSIRMNERQEQTGDILNKLTVLGTIVLPMNIICGMWGMNVKVPGQDAEGLWWFWGSKSTMTLQSLPIEY